jgi:hypothetical protein
MKQRLKFECWHCERIFSLFLETDEKPDLISECPFCNKPVLIELDPFRDKGTHLFRNPSAAQEDIPREGGFPEQIPTREPDNETSEEE